VEGGATQRRMHRILGPGRKEAAQRGMQVGSLAADRGLRTRGKSYRTVPTPAWPRTRASRARMTKHRRPSNVTCAHLLPSHRRRRKSPRRRRAGDVHEAWHCLVWIVLDYAMLCAVLRLVTSEVPLEIRAHVPSAPPHTCTCSSVEAVGCGHPVPLHVGGIQPRAGKSPVHLVQRHDIPGLCSSKGPGPGSGPAQILHVTTTLSLTSAPVLTHPPSSPPHQLFRSVVLP